MQAELLFSGTELLLGQIVNSNAQYLGQVLANYGVDVYYQTTVGDNRSRLAEAIRVAGARADLVIVTGGLGPTPDDVSREALADALGLELVEDPKALSQVEEFFLSRGMAMPVSNRKQALVPVSGQVLANATGTAPGTLVESKGRAFFLLPGPPRELRHMVENHLLPYISAQAVTYGEVILSRVLRTVGLPEAKAGEVLVDLMQQDNPTLATLAQAGEIHLRLTAKAKSLAEANNLLDEIEGVVRQRVGHTVYGNDETTLEAAVGNVLAQRGLTLAVAESCSGGLLAHRLTNVPGSSRYFMLGAVVYDNRWKSELLGVDPDLLTKYGAVSEEVALAMAAGVRRYAATDIGIGITGIAGPDGGSKEKPVGLVYLATDLGGKARAHRRRFWGERLQVKELASQTALALLWRSLTGDAVNP